MMRFQSGPLMQYIQRYKQLFVEPTNKEEFSQAMEQYYAMINDATANGAIFCGVCRGKVGLYSIRRRQLLLYLLIEYSNIDRIQSTS